MTVETISSLFLKIKKHHKEMCDEWGVVTKLVTAIHLLCGFLNVPNEKIEDFFEAFITLHKNALNDEKADQKAMALLGRYGNPELYTFPFISFQDEGKVSLALSFLKEGKYSCGNFCFIGTNYNLSLFLEALEKFVSEEEILKMTEKYILSIVDAEGIARPLGTCEHMQYSVSRWTGKEFRLRDYVLFDSVEQIKEIIATHPVFVKTNDYSDGSKSPPMALWSGLGISNDRKSSEGVYRISKVSVEVVEELPTGVYGLEKPKTT